MSERPYTMDELRGIVENEGLEYSLVSYVDPARVPVDIREDWTEAARRLGCLQDVLFADPLDVGEE